MVEDVLTIFVLHSTAINKNSYNKKLFLPIGKNENSV